MKNTHIALLTSTAIAATALMTSVSWLFHGDLDQEITDLIWRTWKETQPTTLSWSQYFFQGESSNAKAKDMKKRLRKVFSNDPKGLQKLFFGKKVGAQPFADILYSAVIFFSANGDAYPPLTYLLGKIEKIQITPGVFLDALLVNDAASVALYTTLNLALMGYMGPYEKMVPMLIADERLKKLLVRFNGMPVGYHPDSKSGLWSLFYMSQVLNSQGHPKMLQLIREVINNAADVNDLRNVSAVIDSAIKNGWQPPRPLTDEEILESVVVIRKKCLTNFNNVAGFFYSRQGTDVVVTQETPKCSQPTTETLHQSDTLKRLLYSLPYNPRTSRWPSLELALFLHGYIIDVPQRVKYPIDCVGGAASLLMLFSSRELPQQMKNSLFALISHTAIEDKVSHTVIVQVDKDSVTIWDAWLGSKTIFRFPTCALPKAKLPLGEEKKLHYEMIRKYCYNALGAVDTSCVMATQAWTHANAQWNDVYDRRRFEVEGRDIQTTFVPVDLNKFGHMGLEVRATMGPDVLEGNILECHKKATMANLSEDEARSACQEQLLSGEIASAAQKTGGEGSLRTIFFNSKSQEEDPMYYRHI